MPDPVYLYKILAEAPADPLPDVLPLSALDAKDGFIHLSIARQTPLTAGMFFGAHRELWILKVERAKLDGRIEWFTEPKHQIDRGCPHLHDSATGLGRANVAEVIHVERLVGQQWEAAEGMKKVV